MRSFSMSCDSPIIKGHTPGVSSLVLPLGTWIDGFQIEFLWSVCSKYCSFITYEIMNVKWTNIVFVLRYGDETLHLWKPLLNTNVSERFIAMFNATKHNIRPFHIHAFISMPDCNILYIT